MRYRNRAYVRNEEPDSGIPSRTKQKAASLLNPIFDRNRRIGLALVLILSGCSTVHIDGASQEQINAMRCEQGFGVFTFSIPNAEKSPLLFRTKGVGMSMSQSRMNIGWLDEQRVILPDQTRCQIVIFAETEKTVTKITTSLEQNKVSLANICVLGGESNEKDKSSDRADHDPVGGV